MALQTTIKDTTFGVGDVVRVHQKVQETGKGDEKKTRIQVFEGTVIAVRGRNEGKSFIVRREGAQKIGIEQIYPVASPVIEKIEVVRNGVRGTRHSKLYYIRDKSRREIEKIYSRSVRKQVKAEKAEEKVNKIEEKAKKASKKTSKSKKAEK